MGAQEQSSNHENSKGQTTVHEHKPSISKYEHSGADEGGRHPT